MSNWALLQEQITGLPVHQRAKFGIHFKRPDGLIQAEFTGKPCHFLDGSIWKPIDTRLIVMPDGWYGAPHSDVRIHPDGRVKVEGANYQQRVELPTAQTGLSDDNRIVRRFAFGEQSLFMTEDGFRSEITLTRVPTNAEANKLLAAESGGLPGKYKKSDITAVDANLDTHTFINLGKFRAWLASAKYPVTIDPDFNSGAKCWRIWGQNADYATALATSASSEGDATVAGGQQKSGSTYYVFRNYFKFDTSSIDDGATVTQVNLKLAVTNDQSATDFDVVIKKYDWSAYDAAQNSTTRETAYDGAKAATNDDNIWRNTSGISANTYYSSGNLATDWVSKTGITYYSLVGSRDISESTPTANEFVVYAASTNASYRPLLTVTYTAPSGHPAVNRFSLIKFANGYKGV